MATTIKLLVVDDHPVIPAGVAAALDGSGVKVVGNAASVAEAVRAVRTRKPDVILLDVRLPDSRGVDAVERIKSACGSAAIVMFSAFDEPTAMARAISAGAHDFLLKDVPAKELLQAIRRAAEGAVPSRSPAMRRVAESMANRGGPSTPGVNLTPRESQVLRQITLGLSNKEISSALTISVETVKEHVQNLLRKLALADRTQAAIWAIRNGVE